MVHEGAQVNYFTYELEDGTILRMDWWYIHQDVRVFQPIAPHILPESAFPAMAGYPWHLVKPDRIEDEVALLQHEGMFVNPLVYQADDDIPMELCFFVARPGSATVLLLVTEHDYPLTPPRAYTAPFHRFDPSDDFYVIFEEFWAQRQPVDDLPDFQWGPNYTLLSFIRAVEDHLGIAPKVAPPAEAPVEQPSSVSIAVDVEDDEEEAPVASVDGQASTDGTANPNKPNNEESATETTTQETEEEPR
jgi:hypothetical protein